MLFLCVEKLKLIITSYNNYLCTVEDVNKIFTKFDDSHDELVNQGFIKKSIFPIDVLNSLNTAITQEMKNEKIAFYYSGQDSSIERKKYFYKLVLDMLEPYVDNMFNNYRISRIAIIIKGLGKNSSCDIHADDNSFDEINYFPINIWTPLISSDVKNGTLNIVPKSHKYISKVRGYGIPKAYSNFKLELKPKGVQQITDLGESIVYHPGVLHFSNENQSETMRVAIVLGLAPKNKQQLVYHGINKWYGLKIYKMKMELDEYLYWDEKSILKNNIIGSFLYNKQESDKKSVINYLNLKEIK